MTEHLMRSLLKSINNGLIRLGLAMVVDTVNNGLIRLGLAMVFDTVNRRDSHELR